MWKKLTCKNKDAQRECIIVEMCSNKIQLSASLADFDL